MNYLSVADIRELDRYAIEELGIPQEKLMENAGRAVAEYIIKNFPKTKYKKIVAVCGKGNNGGDGLVIDRLLKAAGYQTEVVRLPENDRLPPAELYVDAIFGTGLKGPVTGNYKTVIEKLNLSAKPIIAVDIPSGINGDSGPTSPIYIKPITTITFVAGKLAMQKQPELFGTIEVVDIGIPVTHP